MDGKSFPREQFSTKSFHLNFFWQIIFYGKMFLAYYGIQPHTVKIYLFRNSSLVVKSLLTKQKVPPSVPGSDNGFVSIGQLFNSM